MENLHLRRLAIPTFAPSKESGVVPWYVDLGVILVLVVVLLNVVFVVIICADRRQKKTRQRKAERFVEKYRVDRTESKKNSTFFQNNGYSWEFVIVLKASYDDDEKEYLKKFLLEQHENGSEAMKKLSEEIADSSMASEDFVRNTILRRLAFAGFEHYLMYSCQKDEIFVKIRAPLKRYLREADRIDFMLPVNAAEAETRLKAGNKPVWAGHQYEDSYSGTKLKPFAYIYAGYDASPKFRELFVNPKLVARLERRSSLKAITANLSTSEQAQGDVLSASNRLAIINSILGARTFNGGAHLELATFKKHGLVLGYFCMHDHEYVDEIEQRWQYAMPWKLPVHDIRNYFGERVGIYFCFQSFVTVWLFGAAFMGFFFWIGVAVNDNDPSAMDIPIYAGLMAVWATLMLEFWKRQESFFALLWGTSGFEASETDRPGFDGVVVRSPVDNEHMVYFPGKQKWIRRAVSYSIIALAILMDLGVIAAVMYLRLYLNRQTGLSVSGVLIGNYIASFVNSFQIIIGNLLFDMVAKNLNEYENHRTDTEYEDALVYKTFSFQFINSYTSLFYIAFAKAHLGDADHCVNYDCMEELKATLGMLFITNIVVGTMTRINLPFVMEYMNHRANSKDKDGALLDMTELEQDFMQSEFDDMLGTFNKLSADALQFGYLTMFISAYPLASLMCLVQNLITIRVDAFTMCNLFRRPLPRLAQDIGSWQSIYEFLGFAAVITNSAIIAFTGKFAEGFLPETRVWIFTGSAALLFTIKFVAMVFVSDVPADVKIQLRRQEFITSKLLDDKPDDNAWKEKDGNVKDILLDLGGMKIDHDDNHPY